MSKKSKDTKIRNSLLYAGIQKQTGMAGVESMTKGVAQDKVRTVGRRKIIMSFVDQSTKLRFHPVGRYLK